MKQINRAVTVFILACLTLGNISFLQAQSGTSGPCFNAVITSGGSVTCPDDLVPWVAVTPTTGTPPFSILWSTGDTTDTIYNVPQGLISVTISDSSCSETDIYDTRQVPDWNISWVVSSTNCSDSTGAIDLTAAGGNGGPFTYLWSTGATTEDISGLPGGNYSVTVTDTQFCTAVRTIFVTGGGVELGSSFQTTCADDFTFDAGAGYFTYLWSTGQTTQTITVSTTGTYWVQVQDSSGCMTGDTVMLQFYNPTTVSIQPSGNVSICEGSSVVLNASDPSIFAYSWSTGETSGDISVSTAGAYYVVGTDGNGCADTSNVVDVSVLPLPAVSLGPDTGYCTLSEVQLTPGPGYNAYLWSTGATTDTISVSNVGGYWVRVTGSNGCTARDTILVERYPLPNPDIGPDLTFCVGLTQTLDAGTGYQNYQWNTQEITQTISPTQSGPYQVTVQDSNGCWGGSNTVIVTILPLPADPVISIDGGTISTTQYATYQWYFETALLPGETGQTHVPQQPGYYQVEVTDANNCGTTLSDSFLVVFEITNDNIPEGFSPNNDGIHDAFVIKFLEFFPTNELIIMNRWGNEVYKAENYDNTWQGVSSNGKDLPDGTYFYVLKLPDADQEPVSGYVIINR